MSNDDYKVEVLNNDPGQPDLSFKIIIIGDSFVGKSSLAIKATKGTFDSLYTPTLGFEFLTFYVKLNDKNIKLQIWDTCGQETYRSLIGSFYRNSSLALIVYSIDNENSFNNIEIWLNDLKTKGNPDVNIFLIGNKADLEDKRMITKDMANDLCDIHNINFFLETSAKTGFNAKNIFIQAAKLLYEQHMKYKDRASRIGSLAPDQYQPEINTNNIMLDDEEDKPRKKKKCC